MVDYYNNDFICNCEAYLRHPTFCKHIFANSHKYNIELLEEFTYLILNIEEQFDNTEIMKRSTVY
ncbi:10761_t:CDS:2 [Gigaspora margarita]|uniref:10761_t:CDS:1 n=1 Tax=Gigaspora margarita TaxID=4874 RepID=A0ABN7USM7_GIGMA|nr:10761_t:CDS:2 [Gigaspora margarita]